MFTSIIGHLVGCVGFYIQMNQLLICHSEVEVWNRQQKSYGSSGSNDHNSGGDGMGTCMTMTS